MITGKSYVGSSINLGGRLSIYYSKKAMLSRLSTRTSIIYSAILKYDYVNFSLDILEYCDINVLIKREQYYLDTLKPEYNILKIANSRLGSKQSEATKIKISISNKGKHKDFLGKTHTYESRQMMSLSLKSIVRKKNIPRIVTSETRLKLSLRSQGVPIKVFNTSNKFIKEFPTITSAAKYFDVSNRSLHMYKIKTSLIMVIYLCLIIKISNIYKGYKLIWLGRSLWVGDFICSSQSNLNRNRFLLNFLREFK